MKDLIKRSRSIVDDDSLYICATTLKDAYSFELLKKEYDNLKHLIKEQPKAIDLLTTALLEATYARGGVN
jgi:hypothetical protein